MRQGDVWLCGLDPTIGREIQKTRPCLIVSPDELNASLQTIVIVPLTSGSRPTCFRIPAMFGGKEGLILPEQVRAIDRRRFMKNLGRISDDELEKTLRILRVMFA